MATTFPTSLQDLDATRGGAGNTLSSPNHVTHHTLEDDTLEALQTKVGIDNSADTNSLDYKVANRIPLSYLDTDVALTADSDVKVASQKATKAYVASQLTGTQAQLNGTGFVKVTGTTVSYDNSTYLTTTGSAANLTSFPTLNQNTTGTANNVTGTVAVANGGTGLTSVASGSVLVYNSLSVASALTSTSGTKILTNTAGTLTWEVAGSAVTDATLSMSDITTNNFSITQHGFVPKGTNIGKFLKDDGTWDSPSGTGDMVLAGVQTITGAKSFDDATLILKGLTSGTTTLKANAIAGTTTITFPASTGIVLLTDGSAANLTSFPTLNQNTTGNALTATTATSATTATNLAGGSGGTIPYQSAANTTALLANGTAGQVLKSNGTTLAPSWLTLPSVTSETDSYTYTYNTDGTIATETDTTTSVVTTYTYNTDGTIASWTNAVNTWTVVYNTDLTIASITVT